MKIVKLFIKSIYFFFEFIIAMALLKKEKKEYQAKKNILITPLRGIDNAWIDYLLAIRFSSVYNITLIMMRPSSLPFNTAEKKSFFSIKVMLIWYEIKFYILVFLLKVRGVNFTIVTIENCNKINKFDTNTESLIETAKDEFYRRYFGYREYKNSSLYLEIKFKVDCAFYNLYDCLILKVKDTDLIWTSHSIYEWRLPYSLAKLFDKKINVWGGSIYNNALISVSNGPLQTSVRKGYLQKDNRLDFDKRLNGGGIDQPTLFVDKFDEKLNDFFQRNKNIVLLTPNCIWDGDISDRDSVFNSLYEWVKSTIDFSMNNKNVAVIVRFHPAEASLWKNRPGLWKLFENIKQEDNQMFISPSSKVSTIELAKKSNKVIFYSGILALECLYLNIKPFCVSNSFYSYVKGVINVKNKKEYFKIIENPVNTNISSEGAILYEDILCLGLKIFGKSNELRSNPKFTYYGKQKEIEKYFCKLLNE
jgi:hypothetical protein